MQLRRRNRGHIHVDIQSGFGCPANQDPMDEMKSMQTDERRSRASKAIHSAAALAGAVAALSPVPGSDSVLISPIQAALVLKLSHVYDRKPSGQALRAAGYAALGSIFGKGCARLLTTLLPGIGAPIRGTVAIGVTAAIGWTYVDALVEEAEEASGRMEPMKKAA